MLPPARARAISGLAIAVISGTPSTREESALHAFTTGLRPSASLAANGRRIRIGMRNRKTEGISIANFFQKILMKLPVRLYNPI